MLSSEGSLHNHVEGILTAANEDFIGSILISQLRGIAFSWFLKPRSVSSYSITRYGMLDCAQFLLLLC